MRLVLTFLGFCTRRKVEEEYISAFQAYISSFQESIHYSNKIEFFFFFFFKSHHIILLNSVRRARGAKDASTLHGVTLWLVG